MKHICNKDYFSKKRTINAEIQHLVKSAVEPLYISEKDAHYRYGYSVYWFQRKRWSGDGPKFLKIPGGKVLYPLKETDEWFSNHGLKGSTSEC